MFDCKPFAAIGVRPKLASSIMALALLSACGGRDGGTSTPPIANQAPVFTSAATTSVVENTATPIYQAVASDANSDALTYSVTGGADAARFTITAAGQLSFIMPPNYDLAGDADGNNVYDVQVSVSDGKASTALALAVTVTNSKEGVAVHRVATGFTNPVAIAPISDTAMLVAEKTGAVYLLNPQTGTKTLLVQIANVGTVGVTALVAAPTFASDGTFFVMYASQTGYLFVNRYLSALGGATVPDNNGSGTLLAATGDAGGKGDPTGSAQDAASRLGKVLRIAPNPDPFAGASPSYFIISTIATGLHQPNGGSKVGNGVLFADHGQDVAEELDFLPLDTTGRNFGWPFKEGTLTVQGSPPAGLTDPALEYLRTTGLRTGQAIVGGAMGPTAVASLRSQYIFADGSGAIFAVGGTTLTTGTTVSASSVERRDADFAPDQGAIDHPVAITAGPEGTLYILDLDGEIFRVDGS